MWRQRTHILKLGDAIEQFCHAQSCDPHQISRLSKMCSKCEIRIRIKAASSDEWALEPSHTLRGVAAAVASQEAGRHGFEFS